MTEAECEHKHIRHETKRLAYCVGCKHVMERGRKKTDDEWVATTRAVTVDENGEWS